MTLKTLEPGATLGMLGGGQLGRMFSLAARRCGYRIVIFGDPEDSPAGQVSDSSLNADFRDRDALLTFARQVDVVSYEQENIPVETVEFLLEHVAVHPGIELLRTSQNRLLEKTALRKLGIPTADFRQVCSVNELLQTLDSFGGEAILKTATLGYDGKGQARVRRGDDPESAWRPFAGQEVIAERVVDFAFELSIVAARFAGGTCAFYPAVKNDHVNHILDVSVSPAEEITPALNQQAIDIAGTILEHFQVIGVLCVEMFATASGHLVVNELAPRPHNSGHLTIEACRSSQFEQQFRAVCGLPSGDVQMRGAAAMVNLLGDHLQSATSERWRTVFALPEVHVHMYGKKDARIGRKMGHLTVVSDSVEKAQRIAMLARRQLQGDGKARL